MKVNLIVFNILKETNAFVPVHNEDSLFHMQTATKISLPLNKGDIVDFSSNDLFIIEKNQQEIVVKAKDLLKWYLSSCENIPKEVSDLMVQYNIFSKNNYL